jgi:uncharacterized protein
MKYHHKKPVLRELILWVTTDCNMKCSYCYASGGDTKHYMDWETARAAVDIIGSLPENYVIQFAGGEPLLNMKLIEQVVDYTSGMDVSCQLQTNGTLITHSIAEYLKRMQIAVGVSLDGIPDVNDRLRRYPDGRGTAFDVLKGIQTLGEAGIRTGCTCVITEENIGRLPEMVDLLSYLGNVEGISLDFLRPSGRAVCGLIRPVEPETAATAVRAALERSDFIEEMGGRRVRFREVERMKHLLNNGIPREYRCYFDAGQSIVVKPDGDAYPCASLTGCPDFRLGNVHDGEFTEGLPDRMSEVRRRYRVPRSCAGCPDFELCGGPCPAQVYAYGLMDSPDEPPECTVRRELLRYARNTRAAVQPAGI